MDIPATLLLADGGGWWIRCMASLALILPVDPAARLEPSYIRTCDDLSPVLRTPPPRRDGDDDEGCGCGCPSTFPGRFRRHESKTGVVVAAAAAAALVVA